METTATAAPIQAPVPLTESQVQTWSVLSQLAHFLNYFFPIGGVVALILIYSTLGKQSDRLRANARAALNMELSWFIVLIIGLSSMFLPMLSGSKAVTLTGMAYGGTLIAFYLVYRFVSSILNAINVSRGHMAYYRFSVKVI
jgi:uncharacterized Tic20 family protein